MATKGFNSQLIFVIIWCAAPLILLTVEDDSPDSTLELLQVFMRHGNSTPDFAFKEYASWNDATYHPFDEGLLTILLDPSLTDCPRYNQLMNEITNSSRYKTRMNYFTSNGLLNEYIQNHLGLSEPLSIEDLETVYENFVALTFKGISLPPWTHSIFPHPLEDAHRTKLTKFYATPEVRKFSIGQLLQETLEAAAALEKKQLTPKERKLFAYFANDYTIMSLLAALGVEHDPTIPEFGAALIFESHRIHDTSEIGYKILYRNGTWLDPIPYTIPGCQEICPLEYVRNYLQDYVPKETFASMCAAKQ